ncbi:MAG: polyprenyl diphosphate synthase [Fusobacteriota bacterium]
MSDIKNKPKHIAIIMDGNGRWAKKQGKPRTYGHKKGVEVVRNILKEAKRQDIKYLTLYAFSTENWKRSKFEVKALMTLFSAYLKKEKNELNKDNVKLVFSGTDENVSDKLLNEMNETEKFLENNDDITLNIAFNYGGRREIIDGINDILNDDSVDKITEEGFRKYLYHPEIPDPELVIRTGGEMRVSNFLLWEIAYSEFHICDKYWPEFTEEDFQQAIRDFTNRNRRFGGENNVR